MANALGVDLGDVYRTVEAVKGARQDREFKAEDREAARQRAQTVNALRSRVAAGEEGAMKEFVALAPEEAKQTLDAFNAMDERQQAQAKENVETVGRMAAYVMQSQDPETAYQTVRSNLDPQVASQMPDQYDPNFVQMQLARARELDDLMSNPEKVTIGAEDRLYKDGQVIDRAVSSQERDRQNSRGNALIRAQSDGGGRLKSSDTNAIYRQAVGMFGGTFDPVTGRVSGLDANQSSRVQAMAERASELYANQETNTHAQAVAQAARELGIEVQNLGSRAGEPGGGLDRNQLLQQYSE